MVGVALFHLYGTEFSGAAAVYLIDFRAGSCNSTSVLFSREVKAASAGHYFERLVAFEVVLAILAGDAEAVTARWQQARIIFSPRITSAGLILGSRRVGQRPITNTHQHRNNRRYH